MPRGSSSKKIKSKPSSTKYEYVELSKASLATSEACNFYGVVVDATFPYKREKFYVCSLKVIDPTLNPKTGSQAYSSVVMYAQRFEDLPICTKIGDTIRIHRAMLRLWQGKRQFNVNMYMNGSWVLYSDGGISAYSGNKSTQEPQDAAIVKTLKAWTSKFFAQNDVVDKVGKVAKLSSAGKDGKDFDVVAKILRVLSLDAYTNELKLKDASGAAFYALALKTKFPQLKQGSVVKIRSCTKDATSSKNVLVLQHFSNIMSFIGAAKINGLAGKVSDDFADEKAALKSKESTAPVVLTQVDKKHASLPASSLYELFHEPDMSTSTFRTCFYVTKVEPGKTEDAVKAYSKSSKKASNAKGAKGDMIYQVQFLAKDSSTSGSANAYRILLYTHEGLGANFFPVKATNLYSDSKASAKVGASIAQLTRFNSWVDCVVERRHGYYFIKDTKMIL
jgi:hypothetical protein